MRAARPGRPGRTSGHPHRRGTWPSGRFPDTRLPWPPVQRYLRPLASSFSYDPSDPSGASPSHDAGRTAVVLDQHPLWLEAIAEVLRPLALDVVAKTTSVATALEAVVSLRPTLLLMDLDIDSDSTVGLQCLRRARELAPGLDVIVLSGNGETEAVEAAFAVGATAYVVKTAQPEDIVTAVRQVFDHSIFLRSALSPTARPTSPVPGSGGASLTRRELETLRLVSEGNSNAQVARILWVTEQTVKFHLSNVFRKLHVANRTEASRWAQLHGVLTPEDVTSSRPER